MIIDLASKSRILFIVPLPPPVHGSSMMCDYIRQSKLINSEFECDYVNLSTSRSMDEIGKGGIQKYFRMMNALCKTFWKLLTKKYDLCYIALTCHGNGFLKDAPFALLCKLFGRKLIIHQHNKGMSRDLGSPWRVKLLKTVYKNSTVILLSWRIYPDIETIVRCEQIYICPNGIPVESSFKVLPSWNNQIPHLLFLSNLISSKGVYVLLDALKILKESGYQFTCSFVGDESKEISSDIFRPAVSTRGLDDYVKYLGKKYGKEKNEIFATHDIFVFPTFYDNECFPLVLLEAMQAGLPCIATNEGAIPDLLEGVGIIIPSRDAEILALKIKELLDSPETIKKLRIIGRETFFQKYTQDIWENNLLKIFKEIIKN